MRNLFVVVAKVFGILQVYYALAYVTSILPYIAMLATTASDPGIAVTASSFSGASMPFTLAGLVATLSLSLGVAWLLLFQAKWLADKLNIPDEQPAGGFATDSILLIGTILIGLYITASAAPALVSGCFLPSYHSRWIFSSVLSPALRLSFGLLLAIRPKLVLKLLNRGENTHGMRILIAGMAILVLLLVAGWGVSNYHHMRRFRNRSSRSIMESIPMAPRNTQRVPQEQWYRVGGASYGMGTNKNPDFASTNIRDVIEFLQNDSEMWNKQVHVTQ